MPEAPRAALVCRAGRPFACRLSLSLWCPMGGLPGRSPGRRVLAVPKGWFAFFVACQPCLWLAFFPPSPCPPSPPGKGDIKVIFMQGASPLASPRPSRKRHGLNLRCRCPKGGLPGRSPGRRVLAVPKGWLARLVACQPCLWLYFFPPSPCPPSPPGKGDIKVIFMQGASPLASPRPSRKRHRLNLRCGCPKGGLPGRSPDRRALAVPKGWLARLVACQPRL